MTEYLHRRAIMSQACIGAPLSLAIRFSLSCRLLAEPRKRPLPKGQHCYIQHARFSSALMSVSSQPFVLRLTGLVRGAREVLLSFVAETGGAVETITNTKHGPRSHYISMMVWFSREYTISLSMATRSSSRRTRCRESLSFLRSDSPSSGSRTRRTLVSWTTGPATVEP